MLLTLVLFIGSTTFLAQASNPSSNDSDIVLKARQFRKQSFTTTSQWTSIATSLSYDTWYTIRLDISVTTGTYDIYVNDVLKGNDIQKQPEYSSSSVTYISFFVGGTQEEISISIMFIPNADSENKSDISIIQKMN